MHFDLWKDRGTSYQPVNKTRAGSPCHTNSRALALRRMAVAIIVSVITSVCCGISGGEQRKVAAVAAPATPPHSENWPAFHDGGPLRGVAASLGAPPMHLRWTYRASDEDLAGGTATSKPIVDEGGAPPAFEASAAIVNGKVYAGDRAGTLLAIDLETGRRAWAYKAEAGFSASPAVLIGPFQTGAGKVDAIVCAGDEDGTFHAVDAQTGKKLWTFDGGNSIHSSANFIGDKIIFGTDGADIYCLNAADGKKVWEAKAGDRINGAPAIGGAAPGASANAYISGCDAQLRAIDVATGHERFSHDMGALCPGSPALVDGRILIGTDGGRVFCLSDDAKKQFWAFEGVMDQAMVYSSPAVADGIVVVGARDRNVYGLDLATGQKKWVFPTRGEVDSSPVLSGGRVYVGSKDKRLYVLDLHTGKKLWDFAASRAITASPAIGEGVLVIGDTGGKLYCLEPSAEH
jgi:eukaryotic-like serine/threonine-protein kinase